MTRPGTIVFVNNFGGPTLGGGEVLLMHLVRGLMREGWGVHVAAARGSALVREAGEAGAEVSELEFTRARLPGKPARIREIAAAAGARVVVGTGFLTNILVRSAMRGVPGIAVVNIVQTEPDSPRFEGAGPLALAARRRLDACARGRVDAFVAVSSAVRNALCASGIEAERVHVIANGVDVEALEAAAEADAVGVGSRVREVAGGGAPLVGYVGRLAPVKGAEYFVRMAAQLATLVPDARFLVAGSGPEEGRLREIAAAHRLGERLAFLGHVSPAAPVLAACDVVVLPSLSEGMPTTALEAMALVTPVVATAVGGLAEVVADGETGILVPPADAGALADAVAGLLADPARARAMGEAGAARVAERFGLERMVAEYVALVEELAG